MHLSETYLNSIISSNYSNLEVPGYTLVRGNSPIIYYLNSLASKLLDIQFLYECLNFEKNIGGKLCNFLCLCRSTSQTQESSE